MTTPTHRDFTPTHLPLSPNASRVITEASAIARRFGYARTTNAALLLSMCADPDARAVFRLLKVDPDDLHVRLVDIYDTPSRRREVPA